MLNPHFEVLFSCYNNLNEKKKKQKQTHKKNHPVLNNMKVKHKYKNRFSGVFT